ncbi:MAG: tetratricopeptide repeat protein [Ferruginibacter sp.]
MRGLLLIIYFFLAHSQPVHPQKLDSLLEVVASNNKDLDHVKALNSLATAYMRNDLPRAKAYLFGAVSISKDIHSETYESSAYNQLVSLHNNNANIDSASYYLSLLASLSQKAKSEHKMFVDGNYYAAAGLFYKKTGNLPLAVEFMKKAIIIVSKTGNQSSLAGQLMNLGNTYNLLGDIKNAVSYQIKALKIFEEENNEKGKSFCYQNISNSFIELKQFSRALSYAEKSLAIKKTLNDARGIGTTESALGQIYAGLNKPGQALPHYQKAKEVFSGFNLIPEQAKLHFNLATLYLNSRDTVKSLNNLEQSRMYALQLTDSVMLASIDVQKMALTTSINKPALGGQNLLANIEKIQKSGQLPKEVSSYEHIAAYYTANGEYEKALEYTKKYNLYKDSLTNNELQGQIKNIEEQYNLDKNQKEIAILKKDQQLQQAKFEKQNLYQLGSIVVIMLIIGIALVTVSRYRAVHKARELLQMEKLRNGIARDLHDDIGSTLTSINILSKVLLQQPGLQGESQQINLKKIKDHSSTIMENMSDIVWAINPQNDTVEKVIYKMKEFAAEVLDPLNIDYEFKEEGNFSDVKLTLNKRKDLFLIFKEAVNNAAKYSHCSYIKILLKHDGNAINLHVQDNGQGFDQEKVKKGNGLHNIFARAENMLGVLHYKTGLGLGTDMQLSVPSHD